MGIKYEPFEDGEWMYPKRRGFRFMCCDCALIHEMDFKYEKGKILLRAKRDNRATGQARRKINRDLKCASENHADA